MKFSIILKQYNEGKKKGFVLPYTLLICTIMILLTTGISTMLTKQLYFSQIARQSEGAYYAADNALACTLMIDEKYKDGNGFGIFPYDATDEVSETYTNPLGTMQSVADLYGISSIKDITCAQSMIFDDAPLSTSVFTVNPVKYIHQTAYGEQEGRTSTFKMRMALGDGTFRCAKVTVNKTIDGFRQIIAQGYAYCDRPSGTVERAVISMPDGSGE
jgi:hypothetical protein